MLRIVGKNRAIEILNQEITDIHQDKSYVQNCMKAVLAREKCIEKLTQNIALLQEARGAEALKQQVEKSAEILTHLRMLTINAVECIHQWRTYIMDNLLLALEKGRNSIHLPYLHEDQNYLIKLRNDLSFLEHTQLRKYFNFQEKTDPFLLNLTVPNPHDATMLVQYVSKPLLKRIKTCETIIQEELAAVAENAPQVQQQADEVAHAARGHPHGRLEAQQVRHPGLQNGHGGVALQDIITHLGRSHGGAHLRRGSGHGV